MTTRKNDAGKKSDYRKLKKLSKAAFLMVEENADEIARDLKDGSSHGATLSKRLLFELAEAGVDTELLGLGRTITLAERLQQEPQVPAAPDEDAESGQAND
jgi:signal transduction histidine kinase